MSYPPSPRARSIVALIALSALAGSIAAPAAWAAPLRLPKIKPPVRITPLPRPAVTLPDDFSRALTYGTDDSFVVASLDDSGRAAASDVDDTASRVAADAQSRASIEECAGEGLKAAGESYRDRVREAANGFEEIPPPDFGDVGSGIAGCLGAEFPDVPAAAAFDLAKELADAEAQRGAEVLHVSGSAAVLAEWMAVTGEAIAQSGGETAPAAAPGPLSAPPPPPADTGSPPWGLIAIGVIAAIVAAVYFGGRSRRA